MLTKVVTLSTGATTTVAPVPQRIWDIIQRQYPNPAPPVMETTETATGEPLRFEVANDPGYVLEIARVNDLRREKWAEAMFVFGLPEVTLPEDWDALSLAPELTYFAPDWEPRKGAIGRKLDYIEFVLLRNPADSTRVIRAINDLSSIDEEAVEQIEGTFPGDVERTRA